jgi:hypothetical protein
MCYCVIVDGVVQCYLSRNVAVNAVALTLNGDLKEQSKVRIFFLAQLALISRLCFA